MRGKNECSTKHPENVILTVKEFLRALNPRPSHYSRERNTDRLYLPSNLSRTALYNRFLEENPQLSPNLGNRGVKYWIFCRIFNFDFNIRFGYPRSDLCSDCELFNAKLILCRRNNNEDEETEVLLQQDAHWQMSNAFYAQIRESESLAPQNVTVLCLDYQENLTLPITGLNFEYFSSHINVHNFAIHNVITKDATMFMYAENFAKKGSNEVTSCLKWFIENAAAPESRKLIVFADNSAGQNKNKILFEFLQFLAHRRFHTVEVIFPIPGHSFMPVEVSCCFFIIDKKNQERRSSFITKTVDGHNSQRLRFSAIQHRLYLAPVHPRFAT